MVRQAKGKKHMKNMKRKAMRVWKTLGFEKGLFGECLKEVLKKHRERIHEDINKQRQQELQLCCDNNGWIG